MRRSLSTCLALAMTAGGIVVPQATAATIKPEMTIQECVMTVDRTGGVTTIVDSTSRMTGLVTSEYPDEVQVGKAATVRLSYPRIPTNKSAFQATQALGVPRTEVVRLSLRNFVLAGGSDDVRIITDPDHMVDLGNSTVIGSNNRYPFSLGNGFTFDAIPSRAGQIPVPATKLQFEMWVQKPEGQQSSPVRVGVVDCPLVNTNALANLTVVEPPEVVALREQLETTKQQLADKITESQEKQQKLNAAISTLAEVEEKLQQSKDADATKQQELDRLTTAIGIKDTEIAQLENQVAELADAKKHLEQVEVELAKLRQEKQDLEAEKTQLESDNATLTASNTELQQAKVELEATRDELTEAVAEWKRKYQEYPSLESELQQLRADAVNHATELADAREKVAAAQQLSAEAEAKLAQVDQIQAEADLKVAQAQADQTEAETKQTQAEEQLRAANERAAKAEAALAQAETDLKKAQTEQAQADVDAQNAENKLRKSQNSFYGVLMAILGIIAVIGGVIAHSNIFDLIGQGKLHFKQYNPYGL